MRTTQHGERSVRNQPLPRSVDNARASPRRPLAAHLATRPAGRCPTAGGMNVYVRELVSALGPSRHRLHGVRAHVARGPRSRGRGRAGVQGAPHRRRSARPLRRKRCRRPSTSSPTRCAWTSRPAWAPTSSTRTTGCRGSLGTGSSTSSACLSSRRSHAGSGEGRVRRRGARAPRALGGRDRRLLRRDPRALHRGSCAVRTPLWRDAGSGRDRAARCRRRVLLARSLAKARAHRTRPPAAHPVLLFVGRIQPLKGLDVAVRTLAALRPSATRVLVVVGGPSGKEGDAYLAEVDARWLRRWAWPSARRFVPPQPHHLLSSYYRARRRVPGAQPVRVVRARRARGGRVRHSRRRVLQSAACARSSITGTRASWSRVEIPRCSRAYAEELLTNGVLAAEMSAAAVARAGGYTWSMSAARLRRLYADLTVGALVECS